MTRSQSIVATYPDAARARTAVEALRAAGIEEALISLAGSAARPDTTGELVRQDRSMIMRIFWAGLIWGGVGAVVGAGIGYVFALIEFPTGNMAIQIASWAMFVHIAATLWAAYAVIDDGTPREVASNGTQSMVIVRSADAALLDRAEAALRDSGAVRVRRS